MPIYVFDCLGCGERVERYLPLKQYRDAQFHLELCAGVLEKRILPAMVRGDLPGYESPITGEWIEGRRARMEDLRRHNCRPYEDGEREYHERVRKQEEATLDAKIDDEVDRQIAQMPARKRELLTQEVLSGADLAVSRSTPGE